MGSVSNQNCCKGLRFKEKVEKHWSVGQDARLSEGTIQCTTIVHNVQMNSSYRYCTIWTAGLGLL